MGGVVGVVGSRDVALFAAFLTASGTGDVALVDGVVGGVGSW
jgi:hypothetical protein